MTSPLKTSMEKTRQDWKFTIDFDSILEHVLKGSYTTRFISQIETHFEVKDKKFPLACKEISARGCNIVHLWCRILPQTAK